MYRLYFAIALSLTLAFATNTLNAQPFGVIPTGVTDVVATGGQMRVQVPFVVTNASNPAVRQYAMRTISLSKATTGALAKARMFSPWGLALQAAMVGVGYYIDTQNEKVLEYDPADFIATLPTGQAQISFLSAAGWTGTNCTGAPSPVVYNSYGHALQHVLDNCTSDSTYFTESYLFNPDNQCANGTAMQWGPCLTTNPIRVLSIFPANPTDDFAPFEQVTDQNTIDTNIEETDNPSPPEVSVEQITDVIIESPYTTELVETTINDPETNRPVDINIAEIAAVIADLIADLEAEADGDPLTVPTTDSDTDTGTATVTEVAPTQITRPVPRIDELTESIETDTEEAAQASAPAEAQETDPCAANPDSFMCLDTTGEFTETALTEIPIGFDITPISLASGGGCPSPESIDLSYGTFHLDHTEMCSVLVQMNPYVILLFTIASLFVVAGTRI